MTLGKLPVVNGTPSRIVTYFRTRILRIVYGLCYPKVIDNEWVLFGRAGIYNSETRLYRTPVVDQQAPGTGIETIL